LKAEMIRLAHESETVEREVAAKKVSRN
jgi:hypothetical protein